MIVHHQGLGHALAFVITASQADAIYVAKVIFGLRMYDRIAVNLGCRGLQDSSPDTLRQVAQTTGGVFFTARNDARLRDVYERLDSRIGHRRESREMTDVFAGGSAALLLAGGALSALWFRRVP